MDNLTEWPTIWPLKRYNKRTGIVLVVSAAGAHWLVVCSVIHSVLIHSQQPQKAVPEAVDFPRYSFLFAFARQHENRWKQHAANDKGIDQDAKGHHEAEEIQLLQRLSH